MARAVVDVKIVRMRINALRRELAFMAATNNMLMSNVFSTVQCRACSVIASESEVSVVVPEIAE